MPNPNPTQGRPNGRFGTLKNLLAGSHGPGSRIYEEIGKYLADYQYFKEDFYGATVAEAIGATKVLQYAESAAGPVDPVTKTPTATFQSHIEFSTGATNPSAATIAAQKCYAAKFNPWCEMRFQEDTTYATGTVEFVFGFVDSVPASAADILGDIDTPTFTGGIADAAVFGVDTAETLKTTACLTIGTSTAVGKTTVDTALGTPYTQPVLNTDITLRVELRAPTPNSSVSRAFFFINGFLVAERAGPDAEKLLTPVVFFGQRGATVKYEIDYFAFGQEKNGAPFN